MWSSVFVTVLFELVINYIKLRSKLTVLSAIINQLLIELSDCRCLNLGLDNQAEVK